MRTLWAVVIGVMLPLCAHAQKPATPEPAPAGTDLELAKAHYRTGEIYYDRGRFHDAAREFEEAYRLSQRGDLLYNMGKSYDGAGDHAKALGAYRRFLEAVPGSPDKPKIEARVTALQGLVGRVTINASVDQASVELDDKLVGTTPLPAPIEVNPGGHRVTVTREGYRTWRGSFVAAPGAPVTVTAPLESLIKVVEVEKKAPPVPVYKRWWLWTAVGVVLVAGAVTAGVVGSQVPPVDGPFAQLPVVR
jgi:tetratricopeptide (TPR) repeat protein